MKKRLAKLCSLILVLSLLAPCAALAEDPTPETASLEGEGFEEVIAASAVEDNVAESEQALGSDASGDPGDGGLAAEETADAVTPDETYDVAVTEDAPSSDAQVDAGAEDDGDKSEAALADDGAAEIVTAIEGDADGASTEAGEAWLEDALSDDGLSLETEASFYDSYDLPEADLFPESGADSARNTLTAFAVDGAYPFDQSTDNAELLDAYVQQMLDASLGDFDNLLFAPQYTARNQLDGVNRVVYDILADEIVQIADGTHSSARITIDAATLKDNDIGCGPWTAGELNVPSITENGDVTDAAYDAANLRLGLSIELFLNALIADYPYHLYWFDKTMEAEASVGFLATDTEIWINNVIVTLPVSADYATSEYAVDASRVTTARNAIDNAQSIVDDASGSVLERMRTYKNAICELVTYDDDTAKYPDAIRYGDPWQVVNVFDGSRDTNVVCEGYSKAFKYLCDLSDFGDSYDCILATGTMDGGTGAGNHMWNLVRMEDGRNYLVDVTNCDEGTIGYPDKLFMASGPAREWNGAYRFDLGDQDAIAYTYDDDTKATFDSDALIVASTPYNTYPCAITAVANPADAGQVNGAGEYASGSSVSLTATPAAGYAFANWTENGAVVSTDANYTFTATDDRSLVAVFTSNSVPAPTPAGVAITKANFPDESFRNYITENFDKYDDQGNEVGADGYLSAYEINRVWGIDLYGDYDGNNNTFHGMGVTSLEGIQYFTSLTDLQCGYNPLGSLDVSGMTGLSYLDCPHCSLTALNVKGCTGLSTLECYGNALETLDISTCAALLPVCTQENRRVKYERNDRDAYICYRQNERGSLAFDYGTAVTPLTNTEAAGIPINAQNFPDDQFRNYISGNLDKYTAKGRPGADGKLSEREIVETRFLSLTNSDESGTLTGMGIARLDGIRFFTAMEILECSYNPLSSLDVSGLTQLKELYCGHCGLKTLNVSGCANLSTLRCPFNNLSSVDISDCATLTSLYRTSEPMDYQEGESHYAGYYSRSDLNGLWYDYGTDIILEKKSDPQGDDQPAGGDDSTSSGSGGVSSAPAPAPAPAPAATVTTTVISAVSKASRASLTAAPGTTAQLDLGGATGKAFKSSKKKVATVDGSGMVTIKGSGKTRITFKVGKKKRTVTLTVTDPTVPTSVSLAAVNTSVKKGESVTLTPVIPEGTESGFKWTSSNKKVARVSGDGTVTFRKKGKVTITCTAKKGKKKAKIRFNVSN